MDYKAYAPIYDAEYRDYVEDIQFYVRWARRCSPPALELGCGTGRILFALAESGCPVWGLDNCPEMLDQARAKLARTDPTVASRVQLRDGDMREFHLDQEFGLVYMPFREFMHLESESDQLNCLDSIHTHLRPDGRLIINLYDMDLVSLAASDPNNVPVYRQAGGDYVDPKNGFHVYCSSASYYFPHNQTLREERFYDTVDAHGVVTERRIVVLKQRWFFRWEMHHLLHRANFRVESLAGGYKNQSPGKMGSDMIWVARPATQQELANEVEWLENKLARFNSET